VVVSGRVNREPHRCDDAAEVTSTGMPSIASDATEAVQTARCRARDGGPAAGCACRPRPRRRLRLRRPGVPRGSAAALRGEGVGRSPAALAVAGLRRRVVCWRDCFGELPNVLAERGHVLDGRASAPTGPIRQLTSHTDRQARAERSLEVLRHHTASQGD
jgi:hypothetical protein